MSILGEICEQFNGRAEFAYRLPGRIWSLKAPPGTSRPYAVARITSADTVESDSKTHIEERILEIQLWGDDLDNLGQVGNWITERMDSDHEESISPDGLMELRPMQPFLPEVEEDENHRDVLVLTATWSFKTARQRRKWTI